MGQSREKKRYYVAHALDEIIKSMAESTKLISRPSTDLHRPGPVRSNNDSLHLDGFLVLKNFTKVSSDVLADLQRQSSRAQVIFNAVENGVEVKGDGNRKQFRLGQSGIIRPFVASLDKKISRFTSHKRSPWVVIQSEAGCREQPAHTDYEPQPQLDNEYVPLALFLALMPNTRLHVWPGLTTNSLKHTIELQSGDAILFRGDLVHAGAAYDTKNLRMHCYLDSQFSKRTANSTWLVDYAQ
jgi:hypothetical protein